MPFGKVVGHPAPFRKARPFAADGGTPAGPADPANVDCAHAAALASGVPWSAPVSAAVTELWFTFTAAEALEGYVTLSASGVLSGAGISVLDGCGGSPVPTDGAGRYLLTAGQAGKIGFTGITGPGTAGVTLTWTYSPPPSISGISGGGLLGAAPQNATLAATFNDEGFGTLTYAWDSGDGGTSTDESPMFTYNTPGIWSPAVEVEDAFGRTDSYTALAGERVELTPAQVTGLVATAAGPRAVNLTWDAAAGTDTYRVSRGGVPIDTTGSTSYSDTGLTPGLVTGVEYEYTVAAAATGSSNYGPASDPDSATTWVPADETPDLLLIPDPAYCFSDAGGTTPCGAGDAIYVWKDASGNTHDFSQGTSANRPTLQQLSGKWWVQFDGTNDVLTSAWAPGYTTNWSVGVGFQHDGTPRGTIYPALVSADDAGTNGFLIGFENATTHFGVTKPSTASIVYTGNTSSNTPSLGLIRVGGAGTNKKARVNNGADTSAGSGTDFTASAATAELGRDAAVASGRYKGYEGVVAAFPASVSDTVATYLYDWAKYWGWAP